MSLKKTIFKEGFISDNLNAKIVVAGLDKKISYNKIHLASKLVRKGAILIGTNPDKIFPSDRDFKPGAGTIIQAIKTASYDAKSINIGKPNPYFVNTAVRYLGLEKKNVILIGDQLETDILAANNSNIASILINTGVENKNKKIKPSLSINSLM
jgi:4-nitrophenyl phosphatase